VPAAAASSPATARPLVMRPVSTSLTASGPVWLDHGVDADLDERAIIFQPAPDYLSPLALPAG